METYQNENEQLTDEQLDEQIREKIDGDEEEAVEEPTEDNSETESEETEDVESEEESEELESEESEETEEAEDIPEDYMFKAQAEAEKSYKNLIELQKRQATELGEIRKQLAQREELPKFERYISAIPVSCI